MPLADCDTVPTHHAIDGTERPVAAKRLTCEDMGVDCPRWVGTEPTVEAVLAEATSHMAAVHESKEVPAEMLESMKRAMRDV